MAKEILIRQIPDEISSWIEQERSHNKMSQREFIISVLGDVYNQKISDRRNIPGNLKKMRRIPKISNL
jgi:hypothetical protein